MRFLRALLNSGVFMIVLLAGVTLYLVYSDKIRQDHGEEVAASNAAATEAAPSAPQASVGSVNQADQAHSTPAAAVTFPALENPQPMPMMPAPQGMAPMPEMPPMPMMQAPQGMAPMPEMPPMPMMQAPQGMAPMPEMPPMPMMQGPQGMQSMPAMPQPAEISPADQARAAFFAGDLVAAEQQYQAMLSRYNDPDLHGELGNVYFAQQQWEKATMEYMLAVDGLAAQGRTLQAQYVVGILMQVNPEKGQQALAGLRTRSNAQMPQDNR